MSVSIPAGFKLYNDYGKHIATVMRDIHPLTLSRVEDIQLADGTTPVPGAPVPNEIATAIQRELTKRRINAAKARRA
jgi:hypothetical protein